MNWDAIGALAEILGALAVFVTLVYLVRQVGLSNRIGQAEAERDWYATWADAIAKTSINVETARLWRLGLNDFDSLDDDSKVQVHHLYCGLLNSMESLVGLDTQNLVSKELLESARGVIMAILATPGGRQWWSEAGKVFAGYQYIEEHRSSSDIPLTDHLSFFKINNA